MTFAEARPSTAPTSSAARIVVVMRHAHAESHAVGGDHARRLDGRGEREATAAGRWLAGLGLHIDVVRCSTATRARQTWARAARALDPPPVVVADDGIYQAGVDDLIQVINDASAHTLVLVGHNPTVSDVVAELDAAFDRAMRPGAVAVIELEDESGAASGHVTAYWVPER